VCMLTLEKSFSEMQSFMVALCFMLSLFMDDVLAIRKQGVGVRGKLTCGTQMLRNARVKIMDVDKRGPGDLLDEGYTDAFGAFRLDGTTRELGSITPVIKIFHDCGDGDKECQRAIKIDVPKKYIHSGTVTEWFDVGTLNVEPVQKDEQRHCET